VSVTSERLKSLRLEKGLLQRQVASAIGVNKMNYGQYERGKAEPYFRIRELARFFGVTSDYILGLSDSKN
jgi:transcriptional regulator with XRE-family HTH domain